MWYSISIISNCQTIQNTKVKTSALIPLMFVGRAPFQCEFTVNHRPFFQAPDLSPASKKANGLHPGRHQERWGQLSVTLGFHHVSSGSSNSSDILRHACVWNLEMVDNSTMIDYRLCLLAYICT